MTTENTEMNTVISKRLMNRVVDYVHKKLVAGIVGAQAASKFFAFVADNRIVTGKDVLFHFSKVKVQLSAYDTQQLSVVNDSIFRLLETQKMKEKEKTTANKGLTSYIDLLFAESKKEATAHFIMTDGCAPPPVLPPHFRPRLLWICENDDAYKQHHGWMERFGRVCTVNLYQF